MDQGIYRYIFTDIFKWKIAWKWWLMKIGLAIFWYAFTWSSYKVLGVEENYAELLGKQTQFSDKDG